jgi:hypothetical protein
MSVRLAIRAAAVFGASLVVAPTGASAAPNPSAGAVVAFASEAGARAFVQSFYDWYAGRMLAASKSSSGKGWGFIDGIRGRPDSFSPELKRLLEEDYAAARKCPGDVVGLDWDPFLETQEDPGAYTVGKVEKTAQGLRVSVEVKDAKARGARNPIAQADVAFVGGHWIFVDFVEEPTDPKSRQGLVAILEGYEKAGEYKCKP